MIDVLICLLLNSGEACPTADRSQSRYQKSIAKPNVKLNPQAKRGPYVVLSVSEQDAVFPQRSWRYFQAVLYHQGSWLRQGYRPHRGQNTWMRWGGWVTARSAEGQGASFSLPHSRGRVKRAAKPEPVQVGRRIHPGAREKRQGTATLQLSASSSREAGYRYCSGPPPGAMPSQT